MSHDGLGDEPRAQPHLALGRHERLRHTTVRRGRRAKGHEQGPRGRLDARGEQGLLAVEDAVERAGGSPGPLAYPSYGRGGVSVGEELLRCGLDQQLGSPPRALGCLLCQSASLARPAIAVAQHIRHRVIPCIASCCATARCLFSVPKLAAGCDGFAPRVTSPAITLETRSWRPRPARRHVKWTEDAWKTR